MVNTIKNVNIIITAMYSTISPPFSRELKQPPPFPYSVIITNFSDIFNILKICYKYKTTL